MLGIWLLAAGGALGTLTRYGLNQVCAGHLPGFPFGTLVVNITGCFLIGVLAPLALRPEWRLFLLGGFCGGYTTFSAFGLETLDLARNREWFSVALNVIASNLLGLAAVALGWICGRAVMSP